MQSSSQIITNKPTCNFLPARCPSCRPTNSVKALKGNLLCVLAVCSVHRSWWLIESSQSQSICCVMNSVPRSSSTLSKATTHSACSVSSRLFFSHVLTVLQRRLHPLLQLLVINGDSGCRRQQPTGGLTAQVGWLGLGVGGCLALFYSHQRSQLSQ